MCSRWIPLLVAAVCACPPPATAQESEAFGGDDCDLLTAAAYRAIPPLFYENQADSLLVLLDRWEGACGRREVITRTLILGAIWDGAFTEDLYDDRIIDDLAQRGADFRDGSAAMPARAAYDSFTVDLADQLLPHQPGATPEEFFCLYYSGRAAEAWAMVDDGELGDTDLAYYRALRLTVLRASSVQLHVGLTAGNWYPAGDLEFVGEKPLVGVVVGWWDKLWFGRLVGEWRPGRTGSPYPTEKDGTVYLTDRWDAVLLACEAGRRVLGGETWRADVFAGLGVDLIKPLGGSKDLLTALSASVGAGLRFDLEETSRWYLGFDLRSEYLGRRNEEWMNLGGSAWSARFVVGRILTTSDQETRSLLGR